MKRIEHIKQIMEEVMPELEWGKIADGSKKKEGLFISLKDGESIQGVFRGKAYSYYAAYKDPVEYEDWDEGRSKRYKVNFAVKTKDGWEGKIFSQSKTTFLNIEAAVMKYGVDNIFEIKRTGSGKEDTTYSVFFERKLTPEEKEELKQIPLNPLRKKQTTFEDIPDATDNNDLPF